MNNFPEDFSVMIELLNRTAEENAVRVAANADWVGLIEQAMGCNPAPLRELLREIGTSRTNLYPPVMVNFLELMEIYKPKPGRPRKDGNDGFRAAAKAWRGSHINDTYKTTSDALVASKKLDKRRDRHMTIEALPKLVRIKVNEGPGKSVVRLRGTGTASELALKIMSDALFGASPDSLRNDIYPRKKGTTKKSK